MAKGSEAKILIENKIAKAFGNDYIGNFNNKIYLWANDGPGGERVQIAISMTCPKVMVEAEDTSSVSFENSGDFDFESMSARPAAFTPQVTVLTEEEKANIAKIKAIFDLDF